MRDTKGKWLESDLSDFDEKRTDKHKINQQYWVPCRICAEMFMRQRLTGRYCKVCEMAFCEGEHGTFRNNVGFCVLHFSKKGTDFPPKS